MTISHQNLWSKWYTSVQFMTPLHGCPTNRLKSMTDPHWVGLFSYWVSFNIICPNPPTDYELRTNDFHWPTLPLAAVAWTDLLDSSLLRRTLWKRSNRGFPPQIYQLLDGRGNKQCCGKQFSHCLCSYEKGLLWRSVNIQNLVGSTLCVRSHLSSWIIHQTFGHLITVIAKNSSFFCFFNLPHN